MPASAAFPERPIKIIVGFPAGGPLDTHGRLLADKLQAALGQPIIIDYKAGPVARSVPTSLPSRRPTATR